MSENNEGVIFTPKIEEEGRIDEFPQLNETPEEIKSITEEIEAEVQEELKNEGAVEGAVEGATEGAEEEPKELTDEEKHEIFIQALKESKIKFHPLKHGTKITVVPSNEVDVLGKKKPSRKEKTTLTNVTVNQFGADYRKARKRKNRAQKLSRKANR
jgi:hypothetical protein